MITYTEKRFFEWHEDDISVTLRNHFGSYGGAVRSYFADEWGSCEVLFEREGLSGDSEPSRETREETARPIEDRSNCSSWGGQIESCYPMEGNGARPSHMGNGWTEDDVGYTLNATERHAVAYMVDPDRTEQSRTVYDARGNSWTETAPTLTGDHQRRVTDYTALIEDVEDITYQKLTGPLMANLHPGSYSGQDAYNDMFITERRHDQQAILSFQERGSKEGGGKGILIQSDHVGALGGSANQRVQVETAVRRLTPLEAERLQGFPDFWTDIGEWVDSKGRTRQTTDSARYKALGNSIAVGYANQHRGFWMWLMKRITERLGRTGTLGSLFDGIGGFPLAWETYNGKGSARWASEIEDFCIAVTRKRFGEE